MFEDTTGGTSGIDVEAVVANISVLEREDQIVKEPAAVEKEDSDEREVEDDNYSDE